MKISMAKKGSFYKKERTKNHRNKYIFLIASSWKKLSKKGLSSHGLPKRSPTLVLTVPEAA